MSTRLWTLLTRVSISWLYPCNKSSYIRFVYSQHHMDWLKCTEQNVNNQNLTQVSQLYVHVSFCLKVIRSWHNLPTGGHSHVICMLDWGHKKSSPSGTQWKIHGSGGSLSCFTRLLFTSELTCSLIMMTIWC